jgi:DNA repair protein RecO (recombination protein O)
LEGLAARANAHLIYLVRGVRQNVAAIRTLALVLRTVEVFETSLVATLFTRELGKVSVLAKGARRLKSPLQGGLDLLGVSDMVLFPKASESLDLLAEVVPVERFASLRRDLAALYAGYYIAELLIGLTDVHDPHPKLFDAARITLRHIGDVDLRTKRIMRFELACLREFGLMPSLDRCAQCGRSIEREGDLILFGEACGGVVCARCGPGLPHVASLSVRDVETIRILASPGSGWRELETRERALAPARATVGAVISHVLGHRPRLRPLLGV